MPTPRASDPAEVPCPHCGAGKHERCERPDGKPAPKIHQRRFAAAERAQRQRAAGVPAGIDEEWARLFRACRSELEMRGDLTKLALKQLGALVRNMGTAEEAREEADRQKLVAGSTGNDVANPLYKIALSCEAQALALAKALKLTPDTRGTSAPADEEPEEDEEPGDELSKLDELAARRKDKATGKGKVSRASG